MSSEPVASVSARPTGRGAVRAAALLLVGLVLIGLVLVPLLLIGPHNLFDMVRELVRDQGLGPAGWLIVGWAGALVVAGALLVAGGFSALRKDWRAFRDRQDGP